MVIYNKICLSTQFKVSTGTNKMTHQVRSFSTKPDDLSLIPGTHMVEENSL